MKNIQMDMNQETLDFLYSLEFQMFTAVKNTKELSVVMVIG